MGYAEIRLGSSAVECRTYGAQISLPPYPSPSGLGSRLAAGPPGLDALLGRTCPSSEINPTTWASSCQQSQGEKAECDATGHLAINKLLSLLFPFAELKFVNTISCLVRTCATGKSYFRGTDTAPPLRAAR